MKELELYREDNGQYSTSEARQDDVSGVYVQKTDYDLLRVDHYNEWCKVQQLEKANEELLKENAELKSKIFNIAKAWRLASSDISVLLEAQPMNKCDGSYDIDGQSCYELYLAIDKTPAQHLANIKADAVEAAANGLFSYGMDADAKFKLDEYANKLRGES